MPQERGVPEHDAGSELFPVEANTESFFASRVEPHFGHFAPFQSLDRTRISLSHSHFSQ
jgi:hypothetical protein